jgi:hypothetical protein
MKLLKLDFSIYCLASIVLGVITIRRLLTKRRAQNISILSVSHYCIGCPQTA